MCVSMHVSLTPSLVSFETTPPRHLLQDTHGTTNPEDALIVEVRSFLAFEELTYIGITEGYLARHVVHAVQCVRSVVEKENSPVCQPGRLFQWISSENAPLFGLHIPQSIQCPRFLMGG